MENATVVISNSYYLASSLEKKLDISFQTKLKVIWNGIHLENYVPNEMPVRNNTIVSVGRFVRKKGFDVLIEAFAKVKNQYVDAKLIIAGDGIEMENWQAAQARQLAIQASVNFLGLVDNKQIPDVIKMGKVFVLPSRNEAFGITVLEAMALGTPVIATDSGGVREIIEDNRYGYIVPVENSELLAQRMIELLHDNEKCEEFRKNGLNRVQTFSIENVISMYDEVIQENIK